MKHTLIIPTRNRPEYISVAVSSYLSSSRDDIKCIVCDASDSPENVRVALSDFSCDDRLLILDNTAKAKNRISGMADNWSHALDHVNSKWVSIIGDDDVLYPELVDYIIKLEAKVADLEAIRWASGSIAVPADSTQMCKIPLGRKGVLADTRSNLLSNLRWEQPLQTPSKLTGLYHGAIRLSLLKRLKKKRGSWFRYNNIDYEIGWVVSHSIDKAVYTSRMFSINGFSPKSNSWGTRSRSVRQERVATWFAEGGTLDYFSEHADEYIHAGMDPLFFSTLAVSIYGTMRLVCSEINLDIENKTNLNFSKTLIAKGQVQKTLDDYKWYMDNANIFLAVLFGQKIRIDSRFIEVDKAERFSGLESETLYLPRSSLPVSYGELAGLIKDLLVPVRYLD